MKEWINKPRDIHTMEFHSTIKELLIHWRIQNYAEFLKIFKGYRLGMY